MRTEYRVLGAAALCAAAGLWTGDWLASLAVAVACVGVALVATGDRLFVLPLAFLYHWMQTSIGLFYSSFAGRTLQAIDQSDYRPMVLIGLGCCLVIALGIKLGMSLVGTPDPDEPRPDHAFSYGWLVSVYAVSVVFEGGLVAFVDQFPSLRQILVTFDAVRLGVMFLILRRLCYPTPRWAWLGVVVLLEIAMGLTGFFAGFREPIILGMLAMLEVFDRRSLRHWVAFGISIVAAALMGLMWMGIRSQYRTEVMTLDKFAASRSARAERVSTLAEDWLQSDRQSVLTTADALVNRMWAIYYPALAFRRVPSVLPHTDGAILMAALEHIVTPRVFFPDKQPVMSDSEKVRKYSNVWVAGAEQNTTIAFGYAAESYIDFGLPLMFLPVLAFGTGLGLAYAWFRKTIRFRELAVAFTTLSFWLSLYLYERSWATMLGQTVGFFVYLGGPTILLDRLLLVRYVAQQQKADFEETAFSRLDGERV